MQNSRTNQPVKSTNNNKVVKIILFIVLGFALFLGGLVFMITKVMKNSDVVQLAIKEAQKNTVLVKEIGTPIEDNGMISGSISTHNSAGEANVEIPIKGTKGEAILYIEADKFADKWRFKNLVAVVEKSQAEIIIVKNN